jgi:hypothetical protein
LLLLLLLLQEIERHHQGLDKGRYHAAVAKELGHIEARRAAHPAAANVDDVL